MCSTQNGACFHRSPSCLFVCLFVLAIRLDGRVGGEREGVVSRSHDLLTHSLLGAQDVKTGRPMGVDIVDVEAIDVDSREAK